MFLGQGPLAELGYERLLAAQADSCRVVVACSNPSPEGTWWGTARINELASISLTPFISNAQRNDSLLAESALAWSVNCLISVGHPWVLPERLLDTADAALNLHNAPLPRFGGFNTGSHAILEGSTDFGATLHWMEPTPDAGPIAFEERFEIPGDATARSLHTLTLEAGRRLFTRLHECLLEGRLPPRVPMTGQPTIYGRQTLSEHREIADLSDDDEVDRKSRAFWFPPFEPAFYRSKGKKYYVVPPQGMSDLSMVQWAAELAPPVIGECLQDP
jgi:methionyl-tRNA formyltransferase